MKKKPSNGQNGQWSDRLIRTGYEAPDQLLAHPQNPKIHPQAQTAAVKGAISELGWMAHVKVNLRTSPDWEGEQGIETVIDGHDRIKAAMQERQPQVPIDYYDLTPDEEKLFMVTYDPIAWMALTDAEQLDALFRYVNTADEGLMAMLSELAEDNGLYFGSHQAPGDAPEPELDRAAELQQKWGTALAQLWQVGEHRLLCGDCTDKAVVDRVMAGEKAEMVFTDPPYGVAVGDKNKFLNSIARSNRVEENLENDTLDEVGMTIMLQAAFANAAFACLPGGAWYVAAPAGPLHVLFGQILKDMCIWRQTIQWVKNNATFAPLGVDYHWRAEPIFYGWLPGAAHRYYGGRQQDTVWEIDRPLKSPEHPTMKPVELVERAIRNSCKDSEVVFDPFLGSGTTLVACQQLNRKGRGIEISPAYAAVTLERLSAMGLAPELVES